MPCWMMLDDVGCLVRPVQRFSEAALRRQQLPVTSPLEATVVRSCVTEGAEAHRRNENAPWNSDGF